MTGVAPVAIPVVLSRNTPWPITVTRQADGGYLVNGRSSEYSVYVRQAGTSGEWLASVPEICRCGLVPADPTGADIRNYCGVDSQADSRTIAAAVNYIIQELTSHG